MKSKKAIFFVHIFLICVFLISCSKDTEDDFIRPVSSDSILLIDRYSQKLVSYNTKNYTVEKRMNKENYMIYDFSPQALYMTAGHSFDLGFNIITIDTAVNKVYSMKSNEGIFPLAFYGDDYYFIKIQYNESCLEINRALVKFDKNEKKLIEYTNAHGLISYGTVIGNKLYYTVYNEIDDNFSLYSLLRDDFDSVPELEKEDLKDGRIYSQGDVLYFTDKDTIFSDNKEFKNEAQNYFIGENYLVQYQIQNDGSINANLIDTDTGKNVFNAKNIVDFKVTDKEIIFYCYGSIEKYPLENNR